jgi:hypothetical protein
MAEQVHPVPIRALDADGQPVAAAEAHFFRSGTTTPLTLYADSGGSSAHPVPLVASADGTFAAIYNTSAFAVKVDVRDPVTDVSLPGYPLDPAIVSDTGAIAAEDVTFDATSGINQTDVQAAIEQVQANWLAAKTGIDDDIVSGTAGTAGNLAQWNSDFDLVDGPDFLDEDDFASDSATAVASQQSIKAYIDNNSASGGHTLLGTIDASSGTSLTLTGLDLTDYQILFLVADGVGASSAGGAVSLEGVEIFNPGSSTYDGMAWVDLTSGVVVAVGEAASTTTNGGNTGLTTASTSFTISIVTNAFDAGEFKAYGVA